MRLGNRPLGFVINFLLGASWAMVFLGALSFFFSLYHDSIVAALLYAIVGAVPGLVGVLFLEHILTNKEKLAELKKQTRLLERIAKNK